MQEIKCPKCGEQFTIDETGYAEIVKQVRDAEFAKEVSEREAYFKKDKEAAVQLEVAKNEEKKNREIAALNTELAELKSAVQASVDKAVAAEAEKLHTKEMEIAGLKNELEKEKMKLDAAVKEAVVEKATEIAALNSRIELDKKQAELELQNLRERHQDELRLKDEMIAQYKDFKLRQSTKMIGESLEQYCYNEFNKVRSTAYPLAYFEKDNDSSSGSKGDFIFRESKDGLEFVSIMFEMKNENDGTATKHKNEDFFKELDKDRREKKCEYAVLVSMLEADNDYYNTGIVDVSHRFEKMYVVRPQFFLTLIGILKNSALSSLAAKQELQTIRNKEIDISTFEEELTNFQTDLGRNAELFGKKFTTAIDEIDKTIDHLQKVKENLLSSNRQLDIATRKANDLSVKRLTRNNPTMKALFAQQQKEKKEVTAEEEL